jgi:hypothetical protein
VASKPPSLTLVTCLAYSSTLKMEAICSSETSVGTQRTTRRYIPDDSTLNHRCENLKSDIGVYAVCCRDGCASSWVSDVVRYVITMQLTELWNHPWRYRPHTYVVSCRIWSAETVGWGALPLSVGKASLHCFSSRAAHWGNHGNKR